MSDYKYAMQLRAEELAELEFGTDFYSLDNEQQYRLYSQAMDDYGDSLASQADYLRKAEREG